MYFYKPADALVPVSGSGGGEPVAQADLPSIPVPGASAAPTPPPAVPAASVPPPAVPAAKAPEFKAIPPMPVPAPLHQPAPVPERPAVPAAQPTAPEQTAPVVAPPAPAATAPRQPLGGQPMTRQPESKIDISQYTKLPPRELIFQSRGDPELERIIVTGVRTYLQEQAAKENRQYVEKEPLQFPLLVPPGGGVPYQAKTASYPPMKAQHEPLYVVHRRLHFEEKNAERYGWDLGIIQPFVSTMYFYRDVLLWPNSLASGFAYGFWDSNAGKCLPGTPTPYFLYPPGLTVTGTVAEAAVVTGLGFIIP